MARLFSILFINFFAVLLISLPLPSYSWAKITPPLPPPKPVKPTLPSLLSLFSNWENRFVSDSSIYGGSKPEVAYGRGRFGVVFDDNRDGNNEIYFNLLNYKGKKVGEDLRITNDLGASWNPTIVWNERSFGIFWYDNPVGEKRGIYYASVSHKGEIITSPTRINEVNADGVHPSAVWNKKTKEYGVTWWDSRVGGAYFARVNREGSVIKETPISTLAPQAYYRPLIETTGNEYAIVWGYNVPCSSGSCPETAFARVNGDGTKIGTDQVITAYGATRPKTIVWNEGDYDVLVGIGHYAKLLKLSADGAILTTPIDFDYVPMSNVEMVWNGKEYGLTWISGEWITPEHPSNGEVVFQTFDSMGNPTNERVRITKNTTPCWNSSPPIWTGRNFTVTWVENLYEPNQAIYFAQGK